MGVGRLHAVGDDVHAAHPVAAAALRPSAHLQRRRLGALARRARRRDGAALLAGARDAGGVEGLAAGVLQTIPAVVIMRAFGEQGRGRALGIFGFGVVLAPAIGPSVGGVLIELYGWRSIFFVMLPFGALGLLLARRYLPVTPFSGEKPPLDWRGLLLVSITTVSLLNGLVQVQSRRDWLGPSLIALSALSLALFVRWQRRTPAPLMHIALFRARPFAVGTLVALIYGMALFGSTYLVPVLLQIGLQYGPSDAGLVLLPAGLALAFALPVTGRLSDHWPAHWMVVGGLLCSRSRSSCWPP